MYNLTLHIEYLLLRHDCVIVPGVGALINVRQPARYDEERGTWLPMTREVRFNGALNHDDGLLASSFARKEQVSFAEGRELARRSINQLLSTLHTDGEVTLGHLGILHDEEGSMIFTPLYDADRLSGILGYTAAPIRKNATAAPSYEATQTEYMSTEQISEPSETSGHKFDTDRNYYIAVNKMFARVAACIAIVLVGSLGFMLPTNRQTNVDKASVMPVEHIIKKAEPSQASQEVDIAEEKNDSEESAAPTSASGRYHAIVATFATEAEAERYVSTHAATGYDLKVVNGRTKSRVSAFNSDNREELVGKINDRDFSTTFGGAWIWDAE